MRRRISPFDPLLTWTFGIIVVALATAVAVFLPAFVVVIVIAVTFIHFGTNWRYAFIMLFIAPALVASSVLGTILNTDQGATIQKGAMLALIAVAALVIGPHTPPPALWLYAGVLTVAVLFTVAAAPTGDTIVAIPDALRAYAGYLTPWLVLAIRLDRVTVTGMLKLVAALPLVAIGVGVILQVLNIDSLLTVEYTGVTRLNAGLASAYLGSFAMFGTFAALWLWQRGHGFGALVALVNLLVAAATGTRGPVLVAAFAFTAVVLFGRQVNGKRISFGPRFFAIVALVAGAAWALPELISRTVNQGSLQGSLSGRETAWAYFWRLFLDSPIFGAGIGAATQAAEDSGSDLISSAFVAPHNTYLQILTDMGVVGLTLIIASFAMLFWSMTRTTDRTARLMARVLLLGMAFYAFFDNLLTSPHPAIVFALLIAIGLQVARESPLPLKTTRRALPKARRPTRVLVHSARWNDETPPASTHPKVRDAGGGE